MYMYTGTCSDTNTGNCTLMHCTCPCIYTFTHTHVNPHKHAHVHTEKCTEARTYLYTCTRRVHRRTHMHSQKGTHMYMCTQVYTDKCVVMSLACLPVKDRHPPPGTIADMHAHPSPLASRRQVEALLRSDPVLTMAQMQCLPLRLDFLQSIELWCRVTQPFSTTSCCIAP